MELTDKEKQEILQAYNIGDLMWLDAILKIVQTKEDNQEVIKLLNILYKMNFIIAETETENYASKYNEQVQELYSEMKIDLTKMLNYDNMWEVL